jgi:hypothetical protein
VTSIDRFLESERRAPRRQGDGNSNRGTYTGIITHTEWSGDPDTPNVFAMVPEISQEFVYGPCRWVSLGRPPQTDDLCLLVITKNDVWIAEYADMEGGGGEPGPEGPEGPMGPEGPEGPPGPTGLAGPPGETGPQGVKGDQGIQGVKGDTGATGAPGATGATGSQGPQGVKGDTGDTGPQGPQGVKGDTGIQGPQGIQGVPGTPGATGSTGSPGTPGEKWFTGSGAPAGATGIVGDWYLDSASGDYYEKTGTSTWTSRGNLKGPTGATGSTGSTGAPGTPGTAGAPGSVWRSGSGAPAGATGVVGDWYLNTANGDVYEKTGASTWTLRDNLTGPQGPQGIQGTAGATGSTGSTGAPGTPGAPGSVWRSGTGAPSGALGIVGDWYENDANGDIYEKTGASTYTLRDNLTGPQGATGPAGPATAPAPVVYGTALAANQVPTISMADIAGFAVLTPKPGIYLVEAVADSQQAAAVTTVMQLAATGAGCTITNANPGISTMSTGNGRDAIIALGILTVPDIGGNTAPAGAGVKVQAYSTTGSSTTMYAGNSVIKATGIAGPQGPTGPGGQGFEWLVRLTRTSVFSCPDSSVQGPITFDGEEYDSAGRVGASPTNVPITESGYYDIAVTASYAVSSAGTRYCDVRAGGTILFADTRAPVPSAGLGSDQTFRDIRWVNAGQNITVYVGSFGATVNCTGVSLMVGRVNTGAAGPTGPQGPPGVTSPGSWNSIAGRANWVANAAGAEAPQWRKDSSGTVFIEGHFRNVAGFAFGGANSVMGDMPAGARPRINYVINVIDIDVTNGPRPICLQIATDGSMTLINAGSAGVTGGVASVICCDNIQYLAA